MSKKAGMRGSRALRWGKNILLTAMLTGIAACSMGPEGDEEPGPGPNPNVENVTFQGTAFYAHDHGKRINGNVSPIDFEVSVDDAPYEQVDIGANGAFTFQAPPTARKLEIRSKMFSPRDPMVIRLRETGVAYGEVLSAQWNNPSDEAFDEQVGPTTMRNYSVAHLVSMAGQTDSDRPIIPVEAFVVDMHKAEVNESWHDGTVRDIHEYLVDNGAIVGYLGFPADFVRSYDPQIDCIFDDSNGAFAPGTVTKVRSGMQLWTGMVEANTRLDIQLNEPDVPRTNPYWRVATSTNAAGAGRNGVEFDNATGVMSQLIYAVGPVGFTQPDSRAVNAELAQAHMLHDPPHATGSRNLLTYSNGAITRTAKELTATTVAFGPQHTGFIR